jgi:hypothetical protein
MDFIRKLLSWSKKTIDAVINAKLGLVAFAINFAIVYWVNHNYGFLEASWAGVKGGLSAFILGGIFGRMSERFSEISNPWLAYPLGSVIPTLLAYSIILPMHWFTGTPKPVMSTLLPMLQSMFINTPSTIFVLRRGFLRQNVKKPAVKDRIWLKRQEKKLMQQNGEGTVRRITLLVPTFWVGEEPEVDLSDIKFDHPTIVGEKSTLPRLLKSLSICQLEEMDLVIVLAADSRETEKKAREQIEEWLKITGLNLPRYILDSASLEKLKSRLDNRESCCELLNMDSYAGVRNCGLMAARLLGGEIAVFIDDDEEILYSDHFTRIRYTMQLDFYNKPVDFLAGHYVYGEDRSIYRDDPHPFLSDSWPKYPRMNKAFKEFLGRDPRFKLTPFAFGGNISLADTIYQQMPFDPAIPRGEDIDYALMARRLDFNVILDKEIAVKHDPPENGIPLLQTVFQDMVRFRIERQKLQTPEDNNTELNSLGRRDLAPYPGPFVRGNLDDMIDETAAILAVHFREENDEKQAELAADLPRLVSEWVRGRNYLQEWLTLCDLWSDLMEAAEGIKPEEILGEVDA